MSNSPYYFSRRNPFEPSTWQVQQPIVFAPRSRSRSPSRSRSNRSNRSNRSSPSSRRRPSLASPNRPRRRSPIRSRVQPPVRLQSPPRSLGGLQLSPRTRARRYYHINRDRILQNRLEKRESIAQRYRAR